MSGARHALPVYAAEDRQWRTVAQEMPTLRDLSAPPPGPAYAARPGSGRLSRMKEPK